MNLYKMIIFGIIGLIIGYKITDISNKIINYKRLETDIDENNFLNSKIMLVLITVITVVLWALSGSINNTIIGLLISAQITIGIIIAYIDVKIRIIPNELVLAMIIVGILFQAINFG